MTEQETSKEKKAKDLQKSSETEQSKDENSLNEISEPKNKRAKPDDNMELD